MIFLTVAMLALLAHALIHFSGEGQPKYPGLNLYPWSERHTSIGISSLVYYDTKKTVKAFSLRWSTLKKKFFFHHVNINKEEIKQWERSLSQ